MTNFLGLAQRELKNKEFLAGEKRSQTRVGERGGGAANYFCFTSNEPSHLKKINMSPPYKVFFRSLCNGGHSLFSCLCLVMVVRWGWKSVSICRRVVFSVSVSVSICLSTYLSIYLTIQLSIYLSSLYPSKKCTLPYLLMLLMRIFY